jgi:hypothetical protein
MCGWGVKRTLTCRSCREKNVMAAWTFQELATLRLWRSFSLKKKAAGGVLDTKRYFAG